MKSSGIEDIVIERGYDNKKKKNTGLKVVIILLILVLALFIGAYYYITNVNKISAKELFITNISSANIKTLLQSDIYTTTIQKSETNDFETETNVSFTTNLKNDELKNVDVSKLSLDISNKNDIDNFKSFSEAVLSYAENEIFKLEVLSNEKSIALYSNEIHDKYVGCDYENISKILNIEYNKNFQGLKNAKRIDITQEEMKEYFDKYLAKVMEELPEGKFSIQENIVIKNADKSVDVTAYTLKITSDELNNIIKEFLITLKEDEALLNKIAAIEEHEILENESIEENLEQSEIIPEENVNENIEENLEEDTAENLNEDIEESENLNDNSGENIVEENPIPVITINPVGTITPIDMSEKQKEVVSKLGNDESTLNTALSDTTDLLYRLICGKKVDMTVKEIQDFIEAQIKLDEYYQLTEGNNNKDFVVNVYNSEEKTEKITVEFPFDTSLDVEFISDSEKDNRIKVTYLKNENGQKNGFSLDFNKILNDANTTIKATYNLIENEKINKKIIVDLKTDGTINSKEIKNDLVLTISTNKGESKIIVDNIIKFKDVEIVEELAPENCLYLDQLSEDELRITLEDLKTKTENLYNSKKENLNFINTNTGGITLEDISSMKTREEAKNALIERVSNMMQEAIDNNQEFTIQNLENLTIDGYEVSSIVTDENAKIVVDTYTFNIDNNFTLTDVE